MLPSAPTVLDKSYPVSRPLYMYTAGQPTGAVKAYLDWIMGDGQKTGDGPGLRAPCRERLVMGHMPYGPNGAAMRARAERPRFSEFAIETLIRVLGFSTIGFVLLIFLFLLREGVPVFFEVPLGGFSPRTGTRRSASSAPSR